MKAGDWAFNEKKIVLSKKNEEQNLYLIVKKLTNKELVLMIENPSNTIDFEQKSKGLPLDLRVYP